MADAASLIRPNGPIRNCDSRHPGYKAVASGEDASVQHKIVYAAAAIVGLALLGAPAAHADPMRCSNVQKSCLADCNRIPDRASLTTCITNCGARQAICVRTGCWNSGSNRLCN